MKEKTIPQPADEQKGYLLLWVGVLMSPIVWLIQFQLRYSLVEWVCGQQNRLVLHIISLLFLAIIAGGGILSWRTWVAEGKAFPTDETSGPHERNLFLSLLGVLMSSMFALVTIAQAIAEFMVDPCRT